MVNNAENVSYLFVGQFPIIYNSKFDCNNASLSMHIATKVVHRMTFERHFINSRNAIIYPSVLIKVLIVHKLLLIDVA